MISNIPVNQGVDQVEQSTPYLPSPEQAEKLFQMGQLNEDTARKLGARIDPALVDATIQAESSGRASAIGPVTKSGESAQGLMQVMPATGAEVAQKLGMTNYDLMNPDDSRAIGSEYLAQQMDKYKDPVLASAAYNAGPGRVDDAIAEAKTNDPTKVLALLPKETQEYVPRVMAGYKERLEGSQPASVSDYGAGPAMQGIKNQAPSAKVLGVVSDIPSPAGTTPDPYALKSEAIEKLASVGAQKAIEEASFMRERANQQEQILKEQQEKEALRQTQIKEQEQKAQQALDEFGQAKIDPNRFWKEKSTGEKIIAGIAIALGALGQGLSKGRIQSNGALDIINGAINRDIEAQKMDILGKSEKAEGQKGILAQMRERFDDERTAEGMTRIIALDQAKLKLEEISAKSKSAEVQANKEVLLAGLEGERQKELVELQKAIAESAIAREKLGIERQKLENENPALRRKTMESLVRGDKSNSQGLSAEDLPEKDRERFIPGLGIATTADDAKKLKQAQISFRKFNNLLEEMIQSRKEYNGEYFGALWDAERGKQQARASEALLALKDTEDMGALDSGAIKVGGRIIPENPAEIRFTGDPVAELQDVQKRAKINYHEKVRTMLSIVDPKVEEQLKSTGSTASATKNAK